MRTAVVIAGSIAAGKSTVCTLLSGTFGMPIVSFGNYVRNESRRQKLPEDRRTLQDLGTAELERLGPRGLISAAVADAGLTDARTVLFDGVRHQAVLREIGLGFRTLLVFVEADDADRQVRVAARDAVEADALRIADGHVVEAEVSDLRQDANVIATTSSDDLALIVATVRRFLGGETQASG